MFFWHATSLTLTILCEILLPCLCMDSAEICNVVIPSMPCQHQGFEISKQPNCLQSYYFYFTCLEFILIPAHRLLWYTYLKLFKLGGVLSKYFPEQQSTIPMAELFPPTKYFYWGRTAWGRSLLCHRQNPEKYNGCIQFVQIWDCPNLVCKNIKNIFAKFALDLT